MANFVTVIGGNFQLFNTEFGNHELHNNFAVEVKFVGVEFEGYFFQSGDGIKPVAGVELGEVGSKHLILEPT